ncbi:MAG TPA: sulfotransferase domain-containing protein [Magnetospirillaceae bacterium]|nr:sulfotransferase domain-containing protein [Magnetospirillaceae bacterium]
MTETILSADWAGREAESLLWLASYPRSGNTFTRILLANYFAAEEEAYDINKLVDFIPADTNPSLWEGAGGGLSPRENLEAAWKARPSMIAQYRKLKGRQPLPGLKTHTVNMAAFGASGFDFRNGDRALYIVRHPLDVLISLADYNAKNIEAAIEMMTSDGYLLRADRAGELEVWGSWAEHVKSWTTNPPCPLLLVRYEELCTKTEEALRSILLFLKAPIIEERLKRAVAASRFDRLREQESANSFIELPAYTSSGRFFREGKSLQWLRKLAPEQAYRLADACEPMMTKLGYTHPRQVLSDGRNALGPVALPGQNLNPDSTSSL